MKRKESVQKKIEELKRTKPNVKGGSVVEQPREQDGEFIEGTKVFRVYVQRKVPQQSLRLSERIPKKVIIDGEEYEVDVYDIGKVVALENPVEPPDPKLKYRPLLLGISTMNARSGGACSLGLFTKDSYTSSVVQLSNQHCFGMENDATPGDHAIQPSNLDGGQQPADYTGEFVRGVPIQFSEYTCKIRNAINKIFNPSEVPPLNKVDVSCCTVYEDILWENRAPLGPVITGTAVASQWGGNDVWAYGRSSGYSKDTTYIDHDGYLSVGYSRGTAMFHDVIIGLQTETFKCIPGDSGSPWFENDKVVGLRFAGSNISWIGCKWNNIANELNVSFPP